MNKKNKIIAFLTTFALMISVTITTFAQSEEIPDLTNGDEIVDEVIDEIIEEGSFAEEAQEDIEEEVNLLFDEDFPVEDIVDVSCDRDSLTYEFEVADGVTDYVEIEESSEEQTVINITEGDLTNEMVILDDGTLIIDGEICRYDEVEEEIIVECEEYPDGNTGAIRNELVLSGYSAWVSKCPKKVSKWSSSYQASKISNLKLVKAVRFFTSLALAKYLGGFKAIKAVLYIGSVSEFASILKGYDPTATAVSQKVIAWNSKKPIGIQKRKGFWYSKAGCKHANLVYTCTKYAYRWDTK